MARTELGRTLDELGFATWYLSEAVRPPDDTEGEVRVDVLENVEELALLIPAAGIPAGLSGRIRAFAQLAGELADRQEPPSVQEVRSVGAALVALGGEALQLEASVAEPIRSARNDAVDLVTATAERTWGIRTQSDRRLRLRLVDALDALDAETRRFLATRGVLDDLSVPDAIGPETVERRSDLVTDLDHGSPLDAVEPKIPTALLVACALAMLLGAVIGLPAGAALWRRNRVRTDELVERAHRDPLTGLWNRAVLDETVTAIAERAEAGFGIVCLDLDGFKEINDRVGHHAGDEVLRACATRLIDVVRGADRIIRLGGDEFVAVLAEAVGIEEVSAVAQRIINSLSVPVEVDGELVTVGVSCGVVHRLGPRVDVGAVLRSADAALYAAKAAGRGRVVSDQGIRPEVRAEPAG
ncbi:MAG: GGDEF domain-containing protein [Microthrixaceae bacterium]|nr:GGDEF domain-containing protein [Microthrixaceae bacterium]